MTISIDMNDYPCAGEGPLVVKLGGAAVDDPEAGEALWRAVAALHRQEPRGVVLVHGGGKAIDRRLATLGVVSERRDGIRITPDAHIGEVVATLSGEINPKVVGRLQQCGAPAVGMTLADGMFARCVKTTRFGFDAGRVGDVIDGDPKLPLALLRAGFLPVVCSVGLDDEGGALNVNADEAAAGVASILHARGLVLLTDVDGVRDAHGECIHETSADEIERLIASGAIRDGMIPKARGAVRAANASGAPTTIASFRDPGVLVRIAAGKAVGTRVLPGSKNALAGERLAGVAQ